MYNKQNKIIEETLSNFKKWVLKPLDKYIFNETNNHFIAFIVMAAAIDNLASMRYLTSISDTEERSYAAKRYTEYIKNYFPQGYKKYSYNLWQYFRCKIVHRFQLEYFDLRQDKQTYSKHL